MSYPNFINKHLEKALFDPSDFISYKKVKGKFPSKYIITYQKKAEEYFIKRYKPKKKKIYSLLTIYTHKNIGFVRMTGIGAPNASVVLEELIALGGKEFINVGTAGGLHHEGVFVCNKALRDEGTSHHYIKSGKFTSPDKELTSKLIKTLNSKKINFFEGTSWTTDAPYRETSTEIKKYSSSGIYTVEMEASALFAVAAYRKVKIASVFVVSDLLRKKWLPKFHRFDVRKMQNKLLDSALSCFIENKS